MCAPHHTRINTPSLLVFIEIMTPPRGKGEREMAGLRVRGEGLASSLSLSVIKTTTTTVSAHNRRRCRGRELTRPKWIRQSLWFHLYFLASIGIYQKKKKRRDSRVYKYSAN
jgi:hypothetical protein